VLDFEEGEKLRAAQRPRVHERLGYGSFVEYIERLFGCVFRRDPISVPTAFDRRSDSIRSAFRSIRSAIPLIRSPIPVIRSGLAERLKHETGMVAAHEATVHAQDSRGSSSSLRV